jgi:hypothetical protein
MAPKWNQRMAGLLAVVLCLGLAAAVLVGQPAPAQAAGCTDAATRFECGFAARLRRVQAYVASRPGVSGVAVSDGVRNVVWGNGRQQTSTYAASTLKLPLVLDILMRHRRGAVHISTAQWRLMSRALIYSDDGAANRLWFGFGGARMVPGWRKYGMTHTVFVPGLARRWGSMKTTAEDLRRVLRYTLRVAPAEIRGYLVGRMRSVAANQRWGVWSAGPAWQPGVKNGWFRYRAGWVLNSVGFAGPNQRYIVAITSNQLGRGNYQTGVNTTSQVARILFPGTPTG